MRARFVNTENVKRFNAALSALQKRGAEEACITVVDGEPGLGKTTVIQYWVAQNACVYLRAKMEWTPAWFLKELLQEFRITPPYSFQDKYTAALRELSARQIRAMQQGRIFGLVIDEADHISRSMKIMETMRDLSDVLELPVVLVGMGRLRSNLVRFPQIASRVCQYVTFQPAGEDDVRKFVDEICEVPIDDTLVRFVHQISYGMNHEIKEAIARMERFGKRTDLKGKSLTITDMAKQTILNDRRTGKPVYVPEVA